jgi:hypothetical protein
MTIDWGTGFIEIGDPPPINPTPSADWPSMPMAAYHGLPGEVVAVLGPHTESDQVALLLQYLVSFGNCVGRRPYFQTEDTRHYPNLFAVMVGNTAKARKGTSADRIRRIFDIADAAWAYERTLGGMSSGEGVIWAVHDPIFTLRKGIEELSDPGIDDKRLLLDEREFYQALGRTSLHGLIEAAQPLHSFARPHAHR